MLHVNHFEVSSIRKDCASSIQTGLIVYEFSYLCEARYVGCKLDDRKIACFCKYVPTKEQPRRTYGNQNFYVKCVLGYRQTRIQSAPKRLVMKILESFGKEGRLPIEHQKILCQKLRWINFRWKKIWSFFSKFRCIFRSVKK